MKLKAIGRYENVYIVSVEEFQWYGYAVDADARQLQFGKLGYFLNHDTFHPFMRGIPFVKVEEKDVPPIVFELVNKEIAQRDSRLEDILTPDVVQKLERGDQNTTTEAIDL